MRARPINIRDSRTWPKPVKVEYEKNELVNKCVIEYVVPMSPDMLVVAYAQLPSHIPRDEQTFVRTMQSRSNVRRDRRHRGGFLIELVWPLRDIFSMPPTALSDREEDRIDPEDL